MNVLECVQSIDVKTKNREKKTNKTIIACSYGTTAAASDYLILVFF